MDVEKSYSLFCQAIANGDMEEAELYYDAWIQWCRSGGFLPSTVAWFVDRIVVYGLENAAGDESPVIFRVYIRPDGDCELEIGDVSYDLDHRGFCGAGEVSDRAPPVECLAALLHAFDRAFDEANAVA